MGGRAADSPPEMHGPGPKKPPGQTLELVEADIDQVPEENDQGLVPGAILADKYLIEREIGRGGIGVIVSAHHMQLDQRVAIKYLQRKVLGNVTVIERFAREARLAAKIRSDHVVRVHDVAADPGLGPYIVMEYLEGNDLGHVVEAGPLPIADAVDYVIQACDALAEAHALGIVHRDIKPDNLFLARRAGGGLIVKILDFGISKGVPTQRTSGGWAHVTTATEAFGTPVYMSPEQLRSSASVDARADVWALGVTLFELLTAHVPFTGETVAQLCTSILADPPLPLRSRRPHAPPELETIVNRCLEKELSRRFRNVAELAQELAPFGREGTVAKVNQIRRVVEEGGASVRPPKPFVGVGEPSSQASPRAMKLAETLLAPDQSVPLPKRISRGVVVAAAAGALVAILLLVVAFGARRRTANDETAPSVSHAAEPPPAPTATPASTWATVAPTTTPSTAAEFATPTPTPTPTPTATPTPTPTPTAKNTSPVPVGRIPFAPAQTPMPPTATPTPPAPATSLSGKPTRQDDYSKFGERR